ncbi:HMA2 domain-containing protein [Trichormus azollae]|uniref:HMA2 domain-containing protein n=1 Tax=Trichormus azollae TaxID=1164 RepID=UPI00325E3CFF
MNTGKQDAFAEWKSLDFWKKQSLDLIPLLTGLAVTGRIGIHGLAAIPVYMLTADATRRVINCLEPEFLSEEKIKPIPDIDRKYNTQIAYNIVHTIPGRIRFYIPLIAQDSAYTQRLETLLKAHNKITNLRVNSRASSIVIAYEYPGISIFHLLEIMELALQQNPSIYPPISEIAITDINHLELPPKTSNVWTSLKPASLSYSLNFMANLPL